MSNDLSLAKAVGIAGLIGGLGAWVWANIVGPPPLITNPYIAVPGYMFMGGLAGFLGVYLIAKTDPSARAHAIAFSLACGLFWGPVISGAEAVVNRSKVESASKELQQRSREVEQLIDQAAASLKLSQDSLPELAKISPSKPARGFSHYPFHTYSNADETSVKLEANARAIRDIRKDLSRTQAAQD